MSIEPLSISSFFVSILVLVILLFLSGVVSSSEVAFFSLTKKDLDPSKWDNEKDYRLVRGLLQKPKLLLATILVLNNSINIAIILVSTIFIDTFFTFPDFTLSIFGSSLILPTKFLVQVVLITFILLLFGEIIPKVYASKNSSTISRFTAPFIKLSLNICSPISRPLLATGNFIEKRLKKKNTLSLDQLNEVLQLTEEDDMTSDDEQKMLKGIVSFGNTETKQIMTPRVDVFALSSKEDYATILENVSENGFSRIPIFDDSIDNITGVLYAKDLLQHLETKDLDWEYLLRPAFFVPESRRLNDLLQDFQSKKIHLAVVVDEYGGTSGVVSLEDVIEEIVGDISDEFDEDQLVFSKLDDNNFAVEGKTSLKDFYRIMDIEDTKVFEENKGEAETLAGFVLEISEEYPKRRQSFDFENYTFLIESIDQKRIKRIKITRHLENNDD